jgi:hypothetical protein
VHAAGLLLLFVWGRRAAGEHAAVDGGKSMDDGSLDGKVPTSDPLHRVVTATFAVA